MEKKNNCEFDLCIKDSDQLVIMAPGFGGKRYMLESFAQYFTDNGISVCNFDYSNDDVNFRRQREDWRIMIQECIKHSRELILWGFSYSGGHVHKLSDQDGVKKIISHAPYINPLSALSMMSIEQILEAVSMGVIDIIKKDEYRIPIVSEEEKCFLSNKQGLDYFKFSNKDWKNKSKADELLNMLTNWTPNINTEAMIIIPEDDKILNSKISEWYAKKIKAKIIRVSGGHFDFFFDEELKKKELDFIKQK